MTCVTKDTLPQSPIWLMSYSEVRINPGSNDICDRNKTLIVPDCARVQFIVPN